MSQQMPTQYETGMPPGTGNSPYQAMRSLMNFNLNAFREPRGVMRILQFIFSICAFASVTGFTNFVAFTYKCKDDQPEAQATFNYDYPFRLDYLDTKEVCSDKKLRLFGDFSSDAQFFVATGVLAFLYCIFVILINLFYDDYYQRNPLIPSVDLGVTALFAILWLSGSAAWANGVSGMKQSTDPTMLKGITPCAGICTNVATGSFSSLNISVILGFLNFFLWTSHLWFVYKETAMFKMKQQTVSANDGGMA